MSNPSSLLDLHDSYSDPGAASGDGEDDAESQQKRHHQYSESIIETLVEQCVANDDDEDDKQKLLSSSTQATQGSGDEIQYKTPAPTLLQQLLHSTVCNKLANLMNGLKIEFTGQLLHLNGNLLINIPPPMTDRLWFGFQEMPDLAMELKLKIGESLQFENARFLNFIESKLRDEIKKSLVYPQMDDIIVPLLLNNNDTKCS